MHPYSGPARGSLPPHLMQKTCHGLTGLLHDGQTALEWAGLIPETGLRRPLANLVLRFMRIIPVGCPTTQLPFWSRYH